MSGRFTSEKLKILAMGTMLLDHAAAAVIFGSGLNEMSPLVENIGIAMRLIGRMAFPLYAFLLVQGFMWTRDWSRYVVRVALFALISEIPFNLVLTGDLWYSRAQNTMVTMLIGLICMRMLNTLEKKFCKSAVSEKFFGSVLAIWSVTVSMVAAELMHTDYGAMGILLVVVLFVFRYRPTEQVAAGCLAAVLIYGFEFEVLFAWIAFFFISRYNGERGRKLGLMPYVFYPVHLLAVWLVSIIIV